MTRYCNPDDGMEAEWAGTKPDLETREWSDSYALSKRKAREEAERGRLDEATPSVCDTEDADEDEEGTRTPLEPERLSGSLDLIIVPMTASEAASDVLTRIRAVTEDLSRTGTIPVYTYFELPADIDNKLNFEAARLQGVSGVRPVGPDDDLDQIVGDSIRTVDGWLPQIEPSYLRRDCGSDALAYLREVASRLTALRSQVRTATEDGSVGL